MPVLVRNENGRLIGEVQTSSVGHAVSEWELEARTVPFGSVRENVDDTGRVRTAEGFESPGLKGLPTRFELTEK